MIRVRRLAPRIPLGKVYELEYRPLDDPDAGWHGVTRSPTDYLVPVLASVSPAVLNLALHVLYRRRRVRRIRELGRR